MTTRATDTPDVVRFGAIDGKTADSYPDLPPESTRDLAPFGFVKFQNGPVLEHGVNGTSMEVVLQVVIDRLEGYQRGAFACEENEEALMYVRAGLEMLDLRTRRRREQGVEGRNVNHESPSSSQTVAGALSEMVAKLRDEDEGETTEAGVVNPEDEPVPEDAPSLHDVDTVGGIPFGGPAKPPRTGKGQDLPETTPVAPIVPDDKPF